MSFTEVLDDYFQQRADQDLFSGAVLVTRGRSRLYARAYGYASRAWRVPNTLATRFDTASITKLFTAIATLQLIDAGLLSLDTRVVERLRLDDTPFSKDITVSHLLTHTSGLGDDADEEAGESYEDVWKERPNYSVTETRDFLPQFVNKPANFPPGEGCRYCNVGYVLLGLLIESTSGMTYRDYVREHIFARSGDDFLRVLSDGPRQRQRRRRLRSDPRIERDHRGVEEEHLLVPADRVAGRRCPRNGRRPGSVPAGGQGGRPPLARADERVPHPSGRALER